MEKSDWKGIGALTVVVIAAFVIIVGTKVITKEKLGEGDGISKGEGSSKELFTEGYDFIIKAEKQLEEDGEIEEYRVVVEEQGYGGPIRMEVTFDSEKTKIESLRIIEQQETEGLGSKITETDFLNRFKDREVPISIGRVKENGKKEDVTFQSLQDGVYEVKGKEYDGYTDLLSMTISDKKITKLYWDAIDADGTSKRMLADQGSYAMSENGLTWSQQADALAAAVIERQGTDFIMINEEGKTDAVSGVSISVSYFVSLVEECMKQASGIVPKEELVIMGGSEIDGITGATISSKAVEKGINDAYEYIKQVG